MIEQDVKSKAGTAAVLSFVFNGLGQLYNGEIFKGLAIIFISTISMLVLIIGSILMGLWMLGKVLSVKFLIFGIALFVVSLIAICIIGIYSILDAYRSACKK